VSFVRHGIRGQTLVPLFYILKNKTVSHRVLSVFRALKSIICGNQLDLREALGDGKFIISGE
jgi:hypothetical protein